MRRQHPLYVPIVTLQTLKPWLLPAVITLVTRGVLFDDGLPQLLSWGFVVIAVLNAGYAWLSWWRFAYAVEADQLVVHKGIWQREVRTIHRNRIHSVHVEQPLLQRLFGVVQVTVETASGGVEPEAQFKALSRAEAAVIQRLTERSAAGTPDAAIGAEAAEDGERAAGGEGSGAPEEAASAADGREGARTAGLAAAQTAAPVPAQATWPARATQEAQTGANPPFVMAIPPETFAMAALTSFNLRLAFAFLAGVLSFADDVIDDSAYVNLMRRATVLLEGPWTVLLWGAAAVFAAWLLSVVLYVWKYAGFRLEADGERVRVSYGLLSKKQITFPVRKVQAAILEQGWLRKPFGRGELRLAVVQTGMERTALIHPFAPVREVERLLAATVPHLSPLAPDRFPPRRAWLMFVRWKTLIALPLAAGAVAWFGWETAWPAVLLVPLAVLWGHAQYRSAGAGVRGEHLVLRHRSVAEQTVWLRRRNVQSLTLSATVFQRRRNLCTITAAVSGGLGGFRFSARQLSAEAAEEVYRWYSRRSGDGPGHGEG